MNLNRRELLKKTAKVAGAVTLASMAGTATFVQPASAHTDIDQEITITMGEMFFQVNGQGQGDAIRVPANQVVRLVIKNEGAVLHDVHFGKTADLDGRKYSDNLTTPFDMLEIPAGGEAWLTFNFSDDQKGEWEIGCFQLGHYEGGMKAPFIVE